MFEEVKREDEKIVSAGSRGVEDMFDKVDPAADAHSALQSGRLTPLTASATQQQAPEPAGARIGPPNPLTNLSQLEEWSGRRRGGGKRMLVIILILLILGGIGAAAYYFVLAPPAEPASTGIVPTGNTNDTTEGIIPVTETPTSTIEVPTNTLIDSDNDGLTDLEEQTLGTDPQSVDSDSDGISDRDELRVHQTNPLNSDTDNDALADRDELFSWQTDPLNPDTDGDTYQDGIEVMNGYDPKGPGKLSPTPTSTTPST